MPANLTRTGVFLYDGPNGSTIRELRLPEEVFHADALATLRSAPLTDERHRTVTVDNWRETAIGHIDGDVRQDGQFVAAIVKVTDKDSIARVDAKEVCELSCGYQCDIEQTSGTWEDQDFDVIQRNMRYNHVALGPENWGRAGNAVRLHIDHTDSKDQPLLGCHYSEVKSQTQLRADTHEPGTEPMTPEEKARFDAMEAELALLKKAPLTAPADPRVDALTGQIAGLNATVVRLTGEVAQAQDPRRLDALVSARSALVTVATKVIGSEFRSTKADGSVKSDLEVQSECIVKIDPAAKLDGKSVEYVQGVFSALTSREDALRSARSDSQSAIPTVSNVDGGDANDEAKIQKAENAARFKAENKWRGDAWINAHLPK